MMSHDPELDAQLAAARARLQAFEDAVTSERLLARLEHESPMHPLLLGYKFFVGLMAADVALSLVTLAMPLVSMDWARRLVALEARILLPVPIALLSLAFCAGALGVSFRYGAILRAASSPLLPDEMREHQAIASEIARLSSRKRLLERGIGA